MSDLCSSLNLTPICAQDQVPIETTTDEVETPQWQAVAMEIVSAIVTIVASAAIGMLLGAFIAWMYKKFDSCGCFGDKGEENFSLVKAEDLDTTFDDLAGSQETIKIFRPFMTALVDPQFTLDSGSKPTRGMLLYGPPGTGKTAHAKAFTGELNKTAKVKYNLVMLSGSQLITKWMGEGAVLVEALFKTARANAPCIIFVDEIDSVGGSRSAETGAQREMGNTLTRLLTELDSALAEQDPLKPIFFIGATNLPDGLDPAIIRQGRIGDQIRIDPPNAEGRRAILQLYLNKAPKIAIEGTDLETLTTEMDGATPADLEWFVNGARLHALDRFLNEEDKTRVSVNDLYAVLPHYKPKPKAKPANGAQDEEKFPPGVEEILGALGRGNAGNAEVTKQLVADAFRMGAVIGQQFLRNELVYMDPDLRRHFPQ